MVGPETPPLFLVTGIGSFPGYGENPEFREYTGITLEQVRNMRLAMWDMADFPPDEMVDIYVRAGITEDADELALLGEEKISLLQELSKRSAETLLAELSPEQIQKLWELEWQSDSYVRIDGENVIIGFERYNALDLSEEQQKRLEALKEEFLQAAPVQKLLGQDGAQKLVELVTATREMAKEMLTDAQRSRLEQLLANKPDFLMPRAPAPPKEEERERWMPGPDSWRPGDPLPPGVLPPPPPPARFPRPTL